MGTVSPWTDAHNEALKTLVASGIAYSQIAPKLNEQFGTVYTRNACIGRAKRMKMIAPDRVRAPKPPRKPSHQGKRIRRVVSNRAYDLFENAETVKLRCVEIVCSVPFADVTGCRFSSSDAPFLFCDGPQHPGSSYCAPHHYLTVTTPRNISDEVRAIHAANVRRHNSPSVRELARSA